MTRPMAMQELDGARPSSLAPFAHMRPAQKSPRARAMGMGVTVAAHVGIVVLLVVGIQVAGPALKEKPIMVDVLKTDVKPADMRVAPKMVAPSQITAPAPVVDIASTPSAIVAAPPKAEAPPAPTTVTTPKASGEGRDSFLGRLLAQLNRFKHYPPAARSAHVQGVVLMHFIMDRRGHVLSSELAKSSGFSVLDREAEALIHRADPLPAMPDSMPGATFDAVVPVEFSLS